jgi:hypothetical protein
VRSIVAGEDGHQRSRTRPSVEILKQQHSLDIARRTVTKYRKALAHRQLARPPVYRADCTRPVAALRRRG